MASSTYEERVGFLKRWDKTIEIKRVISFAGQRVNYYAVGLDYVAFIDFETIEKAKKTEKGGYPTPSAVEKWIVQKVAEGFRLELRLWNIEKYDLESKIGGIPQKAWYESFFRLFEAVQGRSIVWHTYDELHQSLVFINISKNAWPDYWALLIWEREELIGRLKCFISEIWFLTQKLIYRVAERMEKHKGRIVREKPLQVVMEYMEKKNPIKAIQHMLAIDLSMYDKEQKEWLSSIVWQKLLDASEENRHITLDEICINLGYEEWEET
ncbi:hypothetical protein [Thermocrinis sp.]|jgi:hypothetical protein|uniref:hypothetical protein n=1 Tax=Thermocrinis sp. TaxID=2024383 RepID=UPI003BFED6F4